MKTRSDKGLAHITQSKKCAKCGRIKPLSEFHNSKNASDGKVERCKPCRAEDKRDYRAKNLEKISAQGKEYYQANRDKVLSHQKLRYTTELGRARYLKHTYGISVEEFDKHLAAQDGQCAICRTDNPGDGQWNIDHDHACCSTKRSCGKCIAGILCPNCNVGIGLLGDNVDFALVAAAYVARTRGGDYGDIPIIRTGPTEPVVSKSRRYRLKSSHRLTVERFNGILVSQGGRCAICTTLSPRGKNWHVDHNHRCCPGHRSCGECVAGILCLRCNSAIGMLGDDPIFISQAAEYLARTRTRRQEVA